MNYCKRGINSDIISQNDNTVATSIDYRGITLKFDPF